MESFIRSVIALLCLSKKELSKNITIDQFLKANLSEASEFTWFYMGKVPKMMIWNMKKSIEKEEKIKRIRKISFENWGIGIKNYHVFVFGRSNGLLSYTSL